MTVSAFQEPKTRRATAVVVQRVYIVLLKKHNKWIVEDVLVGESEIYPATRKTRVKKKVNITRIFLVQFDYLLLYKACSNGLGIQ